MASSVGRPRRFARLAFVLSLALAVAGVPTVARAQGFFDFLRGLFGGFRPPQQQIGPPLPNRSPGPEISEGPRKVDGTYAAYCVRLCDGRYFPLPAHAGAPSSSPQELCSAMCPATKTEVYTGFGIDHATSARGKTYTSLPNAFAYRDRLADDCSCTGQGATGLAKIDIQSDPTLRPGDIVSTKEGRAVFRGDFAPAASDERVRSGRRRQESVGRLPSKRVGDPRRGDARRAEAAGSESRARPGRSGPNPSAGLRSGARSCHA